MAAITTSSGPKAWYTVFPVPEFPEQNIHLYPFQNAELEQLVFTHSSAGIQKNAWFQEAPPETIRKDNQVLEWLGDAVLKGMTATLLTDLFNDHTVREGDLSAIRAALESNSFYAVICRRLGLHTKLKALSCQAMESDRVLGSLFEAYIGGVYKEIGIDRYSVIYKWFSELLTPYAQAYKKYYDTYQTTLNNGNLTSLSGVATPGVKTSASPLAGSPVATAASSSFSAGGPSSGNAASKHRRQTLSHYTSRLMEYAAKYRLNPPSFSFEHNGLDGALIQWTAIVSLDGTNIARALASTKAEAKHLACKEALGTLKAPPSIMGPSRGTRRGRTKR
ncbi:hypothetical protein RUND412_008908 [Rhizina undulata]